MWKAIQKYDPQSRDRWKLHEEIWPRYTGDVTETPLNFAMEEARRNGEIVVIGPLLTALQSRLREFGDVFINHPKGSRMPDPGDLCTAINNLMPYLGSPDDDNPEPEGKTGSEDPATKPGPQA